MSARLRAVVVALLVLLSPLPVARGEDGDPLERTVEVVELARAWMDVGMERGDVAKVRAARARLGQARADVERALLRTDLGEDARARARRLLDEIEDRIAWCTSWLESRETGEPGQEAVPEAAPSTTDDAPPPEPPVIDIPRLEPGAAVGPWAATIVALYRETTAIDAKAALVTALVAHGGVVALGPLTDLFDEEQVEAARPALHQALAEVGTPRLAAWLTARTQRRHAACWTNVLDVLYRVLERPEAEEPERLYLPVVRAFHQRRDRKLTLGILQRLDAMGREGVAALGEVLYVGDFGYHTFAIERLATKKDARAVPPLVFKMNRFRFDAAEQFPAHDALLQLGWHAVPGLIDRLDDKAAGIWISWTLRKITGETMGTDKRKWHDWWKGEQVRHPELFEDPDERPPAAVTGG